MKLFTIDDLLRIKPLINMRQLANELGTSEHNIIELTKNYRQLPVSLSMKIESVLKEKYKINVEHIISPEGTKLRRKAKIGAKKWRELKPKYITLFREDPYFENFGSEKGKTPEETFLHIMEEYVKDTAK